MPLFKVRAICSSSSPVVVVQTGCLPEPWPLLLLSSAVYPLQMSARVNKRLSQVLTCQKQARQRREGLHPKEARQESQDQQMRTGFSLPILLSTGFSLPTLLSTGFATNTAIYRLSLLLVLCISQLHGAQKSHCAPGHYLYKQSGACHVRRVPLAVESSQAAAARSRPMTGPPWIAALLQSVISGRARQGFRRLRLHSLVSLRQNMRQECKDLQLHACKCFMAYHRCQSILCATCMTSGRLEYLAAEFGCCLVILQQEAELHHRCGKQRQLVINALCFLTCKEASDLVTKSPQASKRRSAHSSKLLQ